MINFIKIQDEVNKLLISKYEGFTVYINDEPQEFDRPSFYIKYITNSPTQINYATIKETDHFLVTYFAPVNEYFLTDKLNMLNVTNEVLQLFRPGFIKVNDRAINVKASSGGSNRDEAYIDLQFEYFEDRILNPPTYDLIQNINMNLKEE